jgi:NADH-quinone oxidoreductase subunit M
VLAALYVLITVQRSLHGPTASGNESISDLNLREKIAIAPVIALLVIMGFFPKPVLDWINPSSTATMQAAGYSDPLPKAGK